MVCVEQRKVHGNIPLDCSVSFSCEAVLLEERSQSKTPIPRIVEWLLVLIPNERHRQDQPSPGLEYSLHFCHEFVGVEDVLQDLVAEQRVEGGVHERKPVAVVVMVRDGRRSRSLGLDVQSDILVHPEEPLVRFAAAPHIEESTVQIVSEFCDGGRKPATRYEKRVNEHPKPGRVEALFVANLPERLSDHRFSIKPSNANLSPASVLMVPSVQ